MTRVELRVSNLEHDIKVAIGYIENLSNHLEGWELEELMRAEQTLKASLEYA